MVAGFGVVQIFNMGAKYEKPDNKASIVYSVEFTEMIDKGWIRICKSTPGDTSNNASSTFVVFLLIEPTWPKI